MGVQSLDSRSDSSNSSFSSIVTKNRELFLVNNPQRAVQRVYDEYRPAATKRSELPPTLAREPEFKEAKIHGGGMAKPAWRELTHGARVEPRGTDVRLFAPH